MTETSDIQTILDAPLGHLDALGIGPPANLTMGRYLSILVRSGVIERRKADSYLEVYQSAGFGRQQVSEERAAQVARELAAGVIGNTPEEETVRSVCDALKAPERPHVEVVPVTGVDRLPVDNDDEWPLPGFAEVEVEPDPVESMPMPHVPRPKVILWVGLVFAWSVAMLAAGHWGPGLVRWGMDEFNYHVLGGQPRFGTVEQLIAMRKVAVENPDSDRAWRDYETFARRMGDWDQAAAALRHRVQRRPENAELLNALAWLLCTADAAHVRDPVEALVHAEKAYALNRAPNITDTLAEAAFQNGDIDRAVTLEQDALSRIGGDADFYRRQLRKFRAAAEQRK